MQRFLFSFLRGEELKYLSHLDLMRLFQRALRRAEIPAVYSRGFTPRPRFSLAVPLPVGVTAGNDFGEIYIEGEISSEQFMENMNSCLPAGLCLTGAGEADFNAPALSAVIDGALYRVLLLTGDPPGGGGEKWPEAVKHLLEQPEIIINRHRGRGRAAGQIDIRSYIFNLTICNVPPKEGPAAMEMFLQVGSRGGVSPAAVLSQLAGAGFDSKIELRRCPIHRQGLYIHGEELIRPSPDGGKISWIKRLS